MSIAPSFPMYPSDFLGDPHTLVMTTEEVGAYCLLLFTGWEMDNRLPPAVQDLADLVRMPVKKFEPIWNRKLKKCFVQNGDHFSHPRLEKIICEIREFRKAKSKAGKASGRKRREKKDLSAEQVFDSVHVLFEQNTNKNEPSYIPFTNIPFTNISKREEAAQTPPSTKKATRLPDDFSITPEMSDYAKLKRPEIDHILETEKFCNYWLAKSGKDATKIDWQRTWKNWILNAKAVNGNGNGKSHRPPDTVGKPPADLAPVKIAYNCSECRDMGIIDRYPDEPDKFHADRLQPCGHCQS